MAKHAGFALTQGPNFGRIDYWNDWKPTNVKTKWLLLSGSSDPPEAIHTSERRPRGQAASKDGPFLHGMSRDFTSMTDALIRNNLELFSSLHKLRITVHDAVREIKDTFDVCKDEGKQAVIYYTGHGEEGTGNWCFRDGIISIEEFELLIPPGGLYPIIISDCCYSGRWADYCLKMNFFKHGVTCLAACPYFSTALDINTKGGEFTCYMTGQIDRDELTKTPVCSMYDDESCPFDKKIGKLSELFNAYLKENTISLNCHTVANGKLSAIFTNTRSESAVTGTYSSTFKYFKKYFDKCYKEGKICSSFACDDSFFLMFFEERRANQLWRYGDVDYIHREISKGWGKGMRITGCGAYNTSWIIIMTNKIANSDIWTIRGSWDECCVFVNREEHEGYRLKGICYNCELGKYFLYMRNTSKRTTARWFSEGELKKAREWLVRNMKMNYQVDFIFKDPTNNKTYIALEETDCPHFYIDLAFDFFSMHT